MALQFISVLYILMYENCDTVILTKNAAKTIFHLTLTILYTGKERLQDPA